MSIITIGGDRLHYEALGHGAPLIYIHGWVGSWRYWWGSMQTLSAQQRTFALDLWGYGDSSKVPALYDFDLYINLLDRFILQLGVARPLTLVGHSLGASICLRYARLKPENVDRVALIALPGTGDLLPHRLTEPDPIDFFTRQIGGSMFRELQLGLGKVDPVAIMSVAHQLRDTDHESESKNCSRPILAIYGERDPFIKPPSLFGQGNNRPKGSQFVTLSGCGHFPMLEQAARFNRLLQDFIHGDEGVTIKPKEYWKRRTR